MRKVREVRKVGRREKVEGRDYLEIGAVVRSALSE